MPYKTKGWSKTSRKAAAQRCKQQKPWQHATGPKTAEGKKRISLNATKHGFNSTTMHKLNAALYAQRLFLNELSKSLGVTF